MKISAPRGTEDILPGRSDAWQRVEAVTREAMAAYGYREIRTPIFEHTELFDRGVGESTDIVEKEMYTFRDRSDRSITLRPEGTAPVARAYVEHGMKLWPQPVKVFYVGPMFRYERPQAGRLRQHYQVGAEAIGSADPALDAELVLLPIEIFRRLGLHDFEVHLNSIGDGACRPGYRERLLEYLRPRESRLCDSCRRRMERNPLRVLDCKNAECRSATEDAPASVDFLCEACRSHHETLQSHLRELGVRFVPDHRLVRGFDYYTRTVFEVISTTGLGAQNAVAGGGRYDGLVEAIGGPPTPGVGFASGIERALLASGQEGERAEPWAAPWLDVFVAVADGAPRGPALDVLYRLRAAGWRADTDYAGRSLKAQLRAADRAGAVFAVVMGQGAAEGPAAGEIVLRDLSSGEQHEVSVDRLIALLGERLPPDRLQAGESRGGAGRVR